MARSRALVGTSAVAPAELTEDPNQEMVEQLRLVLVDATSEGAGSHGHHDRTSTVEERWAAVD
jgi:hypothetical protein